MASLVDTLLASLFVCTLTVQQDEVGVEVVTRIHTDTHQEKILCTEFIATLEVPCLCIQGGFVFEY